jgi:DNA-directed RNA polymerase I subunit RPA12
MAEQEVRALGSLRASQAFSVLEVGCLIGSRRVTQSLTTTPQDPGKEWMFCPTSGYMLQLDPVKGVARCPMTGYEKSLEGESVSLLVRPMLEGGVGVRACASAAAAAAAPAHSHPKNTQRNKNTNQKKDLSHIQIVSHSKMDDYRRAYNLEPLVVEAGGDGAAEEGARVRATVDEKCPACGNQGMEFYTMQLRSADEGQTVFYECAACGHKYSTNT